MSIAIVYYSRTGKTRETVEYIRDRLAEKNLAIDIYELKLLREYSKPLHLNPRLVIDVLFNRPVKYIGDEKFDSRAYDLIILGSPIWIGSITPPIKSFIARYKGSIKAPVVCFTISAMDGKYSKKFRNILESLGYKVAIDFAVVDNVNKYRRVVDEAIENILKIIKMK
jgi:flavodoxin